MYGFEGGYIFLGGVRFFFFGGVGYSLGEVKWGGGFRRVSRRAGPGARAPPLEFEKQKKKKKKKKKVIRANIKLFHLYFATFLVENIIFSASF